MYGIFVFICILLVPLIITYSTLGAVIYLEQRHWNKNAYQGWFLYAVCGPLVWIGYPFIGFSIWTCKCIEEGLNHIIDFYNKLGELE